MSLESDLSKLQSSIRDPSGKFEDVAKAGNDFCIHVATSLYGNPSTVKEGMKGINLVTGISLNMFITARLNRIGNKHGGKPLDVRKELLRQDIIDYMMPTIEEALKLLDQAENGHPDIISKNMNIPKGEDDEK